MRRIALLLGLVFMVAASTVSAQVARRPLLFKDSRAELAQARARGESDVLLIIASMSGRNGQMASAIEDMGGTIQYRDDEVDYLRARVPLDRIEELTAKPALHSVDVSLTPGRPRAFALADGEVGTAPELPLVEAVQAAAADTVWPLVLTDRPLTDRYHPWGDVRAREYLQENPTYDGRGVMIAMIDMNPDMLLPELQVAKNLDGASIPKIAIYETALDVREEDDGRWLHMDDVVEAAGGTFTYRDSTYTAPRDGLFRIARFDEAGEDQQQGAALEKDVNRDGNPEGSSRLFAVLWDEDTHDVWVDTDQDLDFTDETPLSDYGERPVFGVFGTDDPDTPVRESVGFGVQIEEDRNLIAINLGVASHASLVVGAAVGSRGENGRFDGMAPGAQLISVSEGSAAYGQTEATIKAAQHGADVIYFEQSSYITRTYLPRDGRLVPSVISDRLVEKYGPSIVSPTHNYPIVGAIDDIVMGRGVIGIGGHESKENFFLNHGVRVEHEDNLLITGGYGPMGNGALKPDILSPSNYVSTAQGFVDGRVMPSLFELPPGYTIAGGTSTATPTAAGAVALLISGAKQAGIDYDPYKLKWAITRSARWVPHIAAYKQGNGVVNVSAAWEILKELDAGGQMIEIISRAAVRHPYSHLLPTPHEGVGIYERVGWDRGDRDERIITFTRTSGRRESMTFNVSWAGNDHGTFSAPLTVTLPLNTPVEFPVTISPTEYGVHTAHLTLDHPEVAGYVHRTLVTIIAPRPLTASNDFTDEASVKVPRPGIASLFYRVPEGTTALMVDLGWEDREVSLSVSAPDTRQRRGQRFTRGSGVTQVIHYPLPGVWEVRLSDIADTRTFDLKQAKKEEPVPPTPATLTVSALAVEVAVAGGGEPATSGEEAEAMTAPAPGVQDVWITNRMAGFTGGAMTTPVGSARRQHREISHKEQQIFEVEVLPGSTALIAKASRPSDPDADLDVYVFDCTDEECKAARVDGDPAGDEVVFVQNPAAGTWKIVVDGFSVPLGTTGYDYLDVVLNPAYGTVNTTDLPQEREEGDRWLAKVRSWIAPAAHEAGRAPFTALLIEGEAQGGSFPVSLRELKTGLARGMER